MLTTQQRDTIHRTLDDYIGHEVTYDGINEMTAILPAEMRDEARGYMQQVVGQSLTQDMVDQAKQRLAPYVTAVEMPTEAVPPQQTETGPERLGTWLRSMIGQTARMEHLTLFRTQAQQAGYNNSQIEPVITRLRSNGAFEITQDMVDRIITELGHPTGQPQPTTGRIEPSQPTRDEGPNMEHPAVVEVREFLNARVESSLLTQDDLDGFLRVLNMHSVGDATAIANEARAAVTGNGLTLSRRSADNLIQRVHNSVGEVAQAAVAEQPTDNTTQAPAEPAPESEEMRQLRLRAETAERQLATVKKSHRTLQRNARQKVQQYRDQGTFCDEVWDWAEENGLGGRTGEPADWATDGWDPDYVPTHLVINIPITVMAGTSEERLTTIERDLRTAAAQMTGDSLRNYLGRRTMEFVRAGHRPDVTVTRQNPEEVAARRAEQAQNDPTADIFAWIDGLAAERTYVNRDHLAEFGRRLRQISQITPGQAEDLSNTARNYVGGGRMSRDFADQIKRQITDRVNRNR